MLTKFDQILVDAQSSFAKMMTLPVPTQLERREGINIRLWTFLQLSPFVFNRGVPIQPLHDKAIRALLWYSICGGNENYFKLLFGDGIVSASSNPSQSSSNPVDDVMDFDDTSDLPLEYQPSQRGKACGHVFKKGEGVYRCRNCGLDETCVLCARCFRETNHEGHETSFAIASGSGGCCDCGDPEAWTVPLKCKYHYLDEEAETTDRGNNFSLEKKGENVPFPPELRTHIELTVATLLEFIIVTLCNAPETQSLSTDEDQIASLNPPDQTMLEDARMWYTLLLWNDEEHTFQEVIELVKAATGCTEAVAKSVADNVDKTGRQVIKTSDSIPLLIDTGKILSGGGLAVSIRSTREVFKEHVVGIIIDWLCSLSKHLLGPRKHVERDWDSQHVVRQIIGEQLLANVTYNFGASLPHLLPTLEEFFSPSAVQAPSNRARVDYLLLCDTRMWKEARGHLRELYVSSFIVAGDTIKRNFGIRFAENYFSLCRNYIFIDREYDLSILTFSVQLFTVPTIAYHLLTQTKLLTTLFVLLKALYLSDVYDDEYDLQNRFLESFKNALVHREPVYKPITGEEKALKTRRFWNIFQDVRYLLTSALLPKRGLNISNQQTPPSLIQVSKEDLSSFLDLLAIWQGMHRQARVAHAHIDYEREAWIHVFNMSVQASHLVGYFSDRYIPTGKVDEIPQLIHALSETRDALLRYSLDRHVKETAAQITTRHQVNIGPVWRDGFHNVEIVPNKSFRVPQFKVSRQELSFHLPQHWFYSSLLENVPKLFRISNEAMQKVVSLVFDVLEDLPASSSMTSELVSPVSDREVPYTLGEMTQKLSYQERVCLVFEGPFRTLAFMTQIQAGIWFRNGTGMPLQANHYRYTTIRECYDRDLFLAQASVVTLGPDRMLTTLIDRYEIVPWFKGQPEALQYDKDRVPSIVQDFLTVLIFLISERSKAAAVTPAEAIRKEIIHHLATDQNGLTYSELNKRIPTYLLEAFANLSWQSQSEGPTVPFDDLLNEVAIFKPPDGANDSGMYSLKDSFYSQVDPWFWHYTRNAKDSVEEVLKNRLEQKRKRGGGSNVELQDELLFRPRITPLPKGCGFDRLDQIVHSAVFHRVLFYSIWNTCRTAQLSGAQPFRSEMILAQVVQLILIALDIIAYQNDQNMVTHLESPQSLSFFTLAASCAIDIPVNGGSSLRPTTLLELILLLVDRASEDEIKEQAPRLRYIVSRFEEIGGDQSRYVISGWRDKSRWTLVPNVVQTNPLPGADGKGMTEAERRKVASKARQASIMAQFNQAQQSFMANFGDEMDELDDDEYDHDAINANDEKQSEDMSTWPDEHIVPFPAGNCIVCQEETGRSDSPYGMLCHLQPTMLLQSFDLGNPSLLAQVLQTPSTLDENLDRTEISSGNASSWSNTTGKWTQNKRGGICAVSCGHIIHTSCFQTYYDSVMVLHSSQRSRNHPERTAKREFLCPLCKSLGNCLLPISWTHRIEKVNWFGSNVSYKSESQTGEKSATDFLSCLPSWIGDNMTFVDHAKSFPENLTREQFMDSLCTFTHAGQIESARQLLHDEEHWPRFIESYLNYFYPSFAITDVHVYLTQSFSGLADPGVLTLTKLWDCLGYTISAFEAGARGNSPHYHPSHPRSVIAPQLNRIGVLDQLSTQSLTCLSVLSEIVLSHLPVVWDVSEFGLSEFLTDFLVAAQKGAGTQCTYPPLLLKDSFTHLLVAIMGVLPFKCSSPQQSQKEGFSWVSLLWLFDIIRSITAVIEHIHMHGLEGLERLKSNISNVASMEIRTPNPVVAQLTVIIWQSLGGDETLCRAFFGNSECIYFLEKFISSNLLVFGRRATLLFYARFGLVPPGGATGLGFDLNKTPSFDMITDDADPANLLSELDRLRLYLNVPDYLAVNQYTNDTMRILSHHISLWTSHLKVIHPTLLQNKSHLQENMAVESSLDTSPQVILPGAYPVTPTPTSRPSNSRQRSHLSLGRSSLNRMTSNIIIEYPGVVDLVPLPKRLDDVFEEARRRVCKHCGTVPYEPALCLLCGTFVCSQSFCCAINNRGECNLHMETCGGNTGAYLFIKKCAILLLHDGNGHFMNPPYLDIHGEVDLGLRRGRPLFFNQRRYDELRKLWIQMGIPSYIARKMDQVYDVGGWSTL